MDELDVFNKVLSTIAHDLNNLLTVILGKVQLLIRKVKDQEIIERLHGIEEVVNDAKERISKIHAFTRGLKDGKHLFFESDDLVQEYLDFFLSWQNENNLMSKETLQWVEGKQFLNQNPKKGAKVLIIDDDESVQKILKEMLEWEGHQITIASNPENGIELFKGNKYDLVITDLMMPDINGLKVAEEIKKIEPNTPVVLNTGFNCEIDSDLLEKKVIDFILTKPFNLRDLSAMVSDAISRRVR
jgi:CheY-like chemotaxis protein